MCSEKRHAPLFNQYTCVRKYFYASKYPNDLLRGYRTNDTRYQHALSNLPDDVNLPDANLYPINIAMVFNFFVIVMRAQSCTC